MIKFGMYVVWVRKLQLITQIQADSGAGRQLNTAVCQHLRGAQTLWNL